MSDDNAYATHEKANTDWKVTNDTGKVPTWDRVGVAVLMDIRAELQKLNAVFACQNFLDVPQLLRDIKKNTQKPRRKRKAATR